PIAPVTDSRSRVSKSVTRRCSSSCAPAIIRAGISSVPISSRKSGMSGNDYCLKSLPEAQVLSRYTTATVTIRSVTLAAESEMQNNGRPPMRLTHLPPGGLPPMRNLRPEFLFIVLFISAAAPCIARAQTATPGGDVIVQYGVPMKTRDGVTLYADIYR